MEARIGLARAYVAAGQPDKAEKVLKEAMKIDPMRPEPYIELAKIYINQGNIEEAVKILEQGYEKTKNEEIKRLLDEIKTGYETTEDAEQGQSKENND
ncbi:MAG TPA: tetratricopeptide repeat protein [Clostridiaceae bacterium]|nr:tetratricopeptide repeat protein [Clostridiaceae bacterium]